ncbi:MAG: pirin family protein [Burkholderiaceae bacterium]
MKQINAILPAPTQGHWVGDGFPVRPIFGRLAFTQDISPFLMFDYGGPLEFTPTTGKRGVGAHPHRGFETVTLAFQGEIEHGDSVGNRGIIGPGDVQWMTAASGIVHEEFHSQAFARQGGMMEMVQLWVNLPTKFKMTAPRYQSIVDSSIPAVSLANETGTVRVIAGNFNGIKGVANTFSPVELWDIHLHAGKTVELSVPDGHSAMLFIRNGKVTVAENKNVGIADLVIYSLAGSTIKISATEDADLLLMGGEPINEPIASQGPFVMNTKAEISQAIIDYQSGRMGQLAS